MGLNHRKEVIHMRGRSKNPNIGFRNTNKRGFAAMDDEAQRQIASKGGRAAHRKGTAHEWDSKEAKEAGRQGGLR